MGADGVDDRSWDAEEDPWVPRGVYFYPGCEPPSSEPSRAMHQLQELIDQRGQHSDPRWMTPNERLGLGYLQSVMKIWDRRDEGQPLPDWLQEMEDRWVEAGLWDRETRSAIPQKPVMPPPTPRLSLSLQSARHLLSSWFGGNSPSQP